MTICNHENWIQHLYECYDQKIVPELENGVTHSTSCREVEVVVEDVLYRSGPDSFDRFWYENFPPLVRRQKAFVY